MTRLDMLGLRKFVIAMYFGTACFVLCFLHRMSGGETVTAVSIITALYKAANVMSGRQEQK